MTFTLMHEHLHLDLSAVKQNEDCFLNDLAAQVEELHALKRHGVSRIVDVTNLGMGRNIAYVEEVERQSAVKVVSATGCYKAPFLPPWFHALSAEQLAERFIAEIERGLCDETGARYTRKAQIIGEVGSGFDGISDDERKLLHAAALACLATGKFITTHTSLGRFGLEQLDLFARFGVSAEKVILGHTDLAGDRDYLFRLLDRGAWVEFDTIGKLAYQSDELRADLFSEAIKCGFARQLLLSMDITRKSHLKRHGGIGYDYLFTHFLPLLYERGVSERDVLIVLQDNPNRILGAL
ncbi:hypothetical protein KRX11_05945 [Pasteurellaceae bacterium TAE3-ERU1]|nr:hypothetical protein [Pasteurellaceae bacterium TAE3-ERU1]